MKEKKINSLLTIFLLLSPILDLLTGVCIHTLKLPITIGIIVRVLFLISIIFIVLFIFKKKNILIPYLIIGLYCILYLIGILIYKDGIGLMTEIQGLLKVFYFPILLISLYAIKENIHISKLALLTTLFLYLIFIFVPTLFHIGYKTYEITKAGTLGFFNSANEISGIISILTPVLFMVMTSSKKIIPKVLLMIMYIVVILMMGTKTPLLSFIITLGFTIGYIWAHWVKKKEYKKVGISLSIIIIGLVGLWIILPKTNFYKNIETHLEFLEIDSIEEIFRDRETLDHFIFSQRLSFFHNRALDYKESSTYQKLFGIGYLKDGLSTKQIEMDYFDIYYNHGIIGFLIFFSIMIVILYKVLEEKQNNSFEHFMLIISLFLIVFLSFFTGHIITTPSVSYICILLIISMQYYKKKRVLNLTEEDIKLSRKLEEKIDIVKETLPNNNKITFLWYKILNYKTYDIGLSFKKNELYSDISCKDTIIIKKNTDIRKELENKI